MIKTKRDLKECIHNEKAIYVPQNKAIEFWITSDISLSLFRFVKSLRKVEYYHNCRGIIAKVLYLIYRRHKNIQGKRLGIEIWDNVFDSGLTIYHAGNIVVNGKAKIGKNCKLHGNNCIGNNGYSEECPTIGDNVRLGFGAIVIGNVTLADEVIVAAGAVVVDSFLEKGSLIAGIPARTVR